MAIIRNASNQKLRGRAGSMTYYVSEGRQIARQALNNSNYGATASRSEAQQSQRVKWANLVNFYKVCRNWMPKAFENRKKGQSDYNRLMQVNMPYTNIYLTKDQAAVGACIVEGYIISQGSLPSVELTQVGNRYVSNIYTGGLEMNDSTTVGDFSAALVAANTNIQYGMQLSFVSIMQSVDNLGIPRLICTFYEVTLKQSSEDILRDYLPTMCTNIYNDSLATAENMPAGAFAYVVSDLRGGSLLVSTQILVNNNTDMVSNFSSQVALRRAIESYGLNSDVVLSPLTENEAQTPDTPLYISGLRLGSVTYGPNDLLPIYGDMGSIWTLVMSANLNISAIDYVLVHFNDTSAWTAEITQLGDNTINVTADFEQPEGVSVDWIAMRLTSGVYLKIPFSTPA